MYTTLISAEQLKHLVHDHQPLMIFDCSFELMKPAEGDLQYERVHIAGAVRANLDRHLSAKSKEQAVNGGRHPLPRPEVFAAWLASVGFQRDMQAVVYDRQGANYCGRLWWMLKWVGHEAVAVLDGGLQAWEAVNGPVATGPDQPRVPSAYKAGAPLARLASTEDVLKHLDLPDQTLIDARALPRRGRAPGPGGRPHPRRTQPPLQRKPRPRWQVQVGRATEGRVRGPARRSPRFNRGAPLRQRGERPAQSAGHGNRGPGPGCALRGQLERVVRQP